MTLNMDVNKHSLSTKMKFVKPAHFRRMISSCLAKINNSKDGRLACYRALATDDEKQTERPQSVHRGERSDSEKGIVM